MILDKMGGQGNITKTRLTRVIFESNTNEHQIPANVTHYCTILKKKKNHIFLEFDAQFISVWLLQTTIIAY